MTQDLHTLPPSSSGTPAGDAVALLTDDHAEVNALFDQYAALVKQRAGDERKRELAEAICWTVTVHITAKEEVVYPAAADAMDAEHLLHEAAVEHHSTRQLIADIVLMKPDTPRFDASVKVLGAHVGHRFGQEQEQLFPRLRETGLDLHAIGGRFAARREEILAEV
jgi:hemerythrin superfamily protein